MRKRSGPTYLHKLFLLVVFLTFCAFLVTEIYINSTYSNQHKQPKYAIQRIYMSAICSDKRLGNAMFIFASLVGIANQTGVDTVMPTDFSLRNIFQITSYKSDNVEKFLPSHTVYEEYGRRASAYDYRTARLPKQHTILRGYFQSWRYFEHCSKQVAKEFKFIPHITTSAKSFLAANFPGKWKDPDVIRVGIHVRRGDIVTDYYKNYGYTSPEPDYYTRAMEYFKSRYSRVQFVVCSDDIHWAKSHISDTDIIYSENRKDYEDMAILSLCNHTIMSVGSFGWWAAWLANGTTVYYAKWPKEYSKLEYHVDKKAYFPPHWLAME